MVLSTIILIKKSEAVIKAGLAGSTPRSAKIARDDHKKLGEAP